MRLWLLRHSQPLVATGVCYGRLDVEASALHSARAASAWLAALPQAPGGLPSRARCSPLARCRALAHWLQDAAAIEVQADARLMELNFGAWEGRRWSDLSDEAFGGWTADFAHGRPGAADQPGGLGESVAEMLARVASALDECRRHGGDELWITHAGVIRAVQWLLLGRGMPQSAAEWDLPAPAYGQGLELRL